MPVAKLGQVDIYYEVTGPENGEPLVLIEGLGTQMIGWYPDLIGLLQKTGFKVIRFDSRDVGLSSKMDDTAQYTIDDMADDVVGLMDHVGLSSAHVAGQSMGGMIAQQLVINHPEVVHSLTIIYSVPNMEYVTDDQEVWQARNRPPAANREDAIKQYIAQERLSGLDGLDEAWIEADATQVFDRCYCPEGQARQGEAIRNASDRLEALKAVTVPTAVIHGRNDRLLDYRGGIAIATAIDNAELHVYCDMGHQLTPRLWTDYVRVIRRTAERAGAFSNGGMREN